MIFKLRLLDFKLFKNFKQAIINDIKGQIVDHFLENTIVVHHKKDKYIKPREFDA